MSDVDDVARFAVGEDDMVVAAALMCPYCRGRPAQVLANDRCEGADAMCACAQCGVQWSVALDRKQALRLLLAPPRGLWILHRFGNRS
jgi:hypothetical protein